MLPQVQSVPYLFEPGQQQILSDMAEHGMQAAFTAQGPDGQIILHRSGQPVPEGCTMLRRYRLPQEQAPQQPSLF